MSHFVKENGLKIMECQKSKFMIPDGVSYLNCANVSPLMTQTANQGKAAIKLRQQPFKIQLDDWFKPVDDLKKSFSKLISCENHQRVALIPSVSYGIASVSKNIKFNKEDEIVLVSEQYPSNYYSWLEISKSIGCSIKVIKPSQFGNEKGESWNANILKAIGKRTKVVALANVHWADGTLFNLEEISEKARNFNAYIIIDGSQSIGALPFNVQKIKPDALFCVGYKWLLGPFSLGLAYIGERFDNGIPLEENWINRENSNDFQNLTKYKSDYRPYASRYNMGESSNFHLVPILKDALDQINSWGVLNIQNYCKSIALKPIEMIKSLNLDVSYGEYQAKHLFGIKMPNSVKLKSIQQNLLEEQIYVSVRGENIRVSVSVFNTEEDMLKLYHCLKTNLLN